MPLLDRPPPLPVRRIGMVARWKPVHLGHAAVLRAMLRAGDQVLVGIGSSNAYDARNPFTARETERMIRALLGDPPSLRILDVPDLGDPPRWAAALIESFGPLDLYLTANPWVRDLISPHWPVLHPVHLVPEHERIPVDGTMVRRLMARGEDWRDWVPPETAALLDAEGLVERFRREFGARVLADEEESTP